MDRKSVATRRRGAVLESALLEAAWVELAEVGYAAMTFERVAERAQTSRPVVYRRWPTKPDLVRAAIQHYYDNTSIEALDTGSLRGDVIALLEAFGQLRADVVAVMTVRLAAYFEETGTQLVDLRNTLVQGTPAFIPAILKRAADRGEILTDVVTARVAAVPLDLLRNELLFGPALTRETVESIVDEVFIPLVRRSGGETNQM